LGDGKLKTVTFFISKLKVNSLPNNFDFALEAGATTEKIVVSMVRVIQSAEKSGTVGINQKPFKNNSEITIKQHPADELISVSSQNEISQIDLYNILGKKERTLKGSGNTFDLQTNGLTSGIYIFSVQDKHGNLKREKVFLK
jgi:predicted metal-dependent phosphoesterase TrpH